MCVCVHMFHVSFVLCLHGHHTTSALLKQDHLNECQEAALTHMQLSVAVIAKDNCRQNNVHTEYRS